MAQGTRGRWVRVATTGLGVLLCTGLVGCMNTDKDKKKDKLAKQPPTPGLHGTPTIGANAKGAPPNNPFPSGIQQTGGVQQQPRFGSTGLNTNTGTVAPAVYNNTWQNNAGAIGAPAQPGFVPPSVQPGAGYVQPVSGTTGPVGTNTNPMVPNNIVASASPAPTAGYDIILPPPPPGSPTAPGAQVAVQPPTAPFAPVAPDRGQVNNFGPAIFGSK